MRYWTEMNPSLDFLPLSTRPTRLGSACSLYLQYGSTTLEIKIHDSAKRQKGRTVRCDIHKRSREMLPSGEPFVPNEDEIAKYKKSLFLH